MKPDCLTPADPLAPAIAFNDWLRERVRSILDATADHAAAAARPSPNA